MAGSSRRSFSFRFVSFRFENKYVVEICGTREGGGGGPRCFRGDRKQCFAENSVRCLSTDWPLILGPDKVGKYVGFYEECWRRSFQGKDSPYPLWSGKYQQGQNPTAPGGIFLPLLLQRLENYSLRIRLKRE